MAGISSLARAFTAGGLNSSVASCTLTQLDETDLEDSSTTRAFQYFPETLQDSKSSNWSQKEIPGASLPLYQWISSGERSLSFTAMFTNDVDPRLVTDEQLQQAGLLRRNVDIISAMAWLRAMILPRYGTGPQERSEAGTPLVFAPRKLLLAIPFSGLGVIGGDTTNGDDAVLVICTQCDYSIEAWWPSGSPRVVSASLNFSQIAQREGRVTFPSNSTTFQKRVLEGGFDRNFRPYKNLIATAKRF